MRVKREMRDICGKLHIVPSVPAVTIAGMELRTFLLALSARSPVVAARELGVDRVTVSRWLNGTRKPSRTVLLLAELLWGGARSREWPAEP
jgi:hypothetical protein